MIIAHRGASFTAPENTIAAIDAAWRADADAVEVDLRLTADKRIMLMHDPSTRRTTGEDHIIAETGSDIIRKLDAGGWKSPRYAGEKVPFIEEALATVPSGRRLFVEIKSDASIFPVLRPFLNPAVCTVIGFDLEIMAQCKALMPDMTVYWLYEPPRLLAYGPRRISRPGNIIDAAKSRHVDGIDVYHKSISSELCRIAEKAGIDVFAWTIDTPGEARRLLDTGVAGITTNRPELLKAQGL